MNYKILIVLVLIFSGCEEIDKESLKALNGYSKKVEIDKKDKTFKLVPTTVEVKVDKNLSVTKLLPKIEPKKIPLVSKVELKPKEATDKRFKLALLQIQKDKELKDQADRNFELLREKVKNEQILKLKSKEIELSKAEVDGKVSIAEIELKKTLESEKTNQLIQKQTYAQTLMENRNKFEKDKRDTLFAKDELEFYKIIAGIVGFLFLLLMFVVYFFKRLKEQSKIKISENELSHQMQLKILEHQSRNFDKMLELVSSQKLSENVEKELLNNIKESQKKTLIFDQKPKRGLIFRK